MSISRLATIAIVIFGILIQAPILSLIQPVSNININITFDGQPADALIRVIRNDSVIQIEYTDVHTPGLAAFELPIGNYILSIEHGAGYISRPEIIEISVDESSSLEIDVNVPRLIDPREQGYYSADLHVHTAASAPAMQRDFGILNHGVTPTDQAVGIQLAAGLDVMFISDHNTADGHEVFVEISEIRNAPFLLSQEITTTRWGHFNPISLDQNSAVSFNFSKTPSAFFSEARELGAEAIQINHPLSSTFGYFFSQNQPEYDASFDLVEVFNGSFTEGDRQAILRMFDFWNQGIRYVATGVSDDHDWKSTGTEYGRARTFVHINGELTSEAYLENLITGHAFVSHGPMVYLSANGGSIPGDNLELSSSQSLDITISIDSVDLLEGVRVDLLRNGTIQESFEPNGQFATFTYHDNPEEDSWYVVRMLTENGDYLALTNPLWVSITP
jgi:hypothetical protein